MSGPRENDLFMICIILIGITLFYTKLYLNKFIYS